MNDELITNLEDLGLSQKEARVYLANLILGPATVQKIADQSGIKRVTTYVILESLNNMGLVSQSNKGKKTYFVAAEPVQLKRLLQKKEEQIKEQKAHFEGVLPELQQLKGMPVESPNVRFYDTAEGIRGMMASFLSSHKRDEVETVYGISNLDQLYEFFPEFAAQGGNPDRIKSQVPSKIIYTSKQGPIMKPNDRALNRQSRFVPETGFELNGDLSIVGDYVVLLSLTGNKPIGITIQSDQLAKTMLGLFELAWETAAKYQSAK
jgi:sugar-specific transcriptional regulator TrmB